MPLNPGNSALATDYNKIDTLYHGTTSNALPGIQKHGIKGQGYETSENDRGVHAYVTPKKDIAEEYAVASSLQRGNPGTKGVILHLNRNHPSLKGLKIDPEYKEHGGRDTSFRIKGTIHPDAIKHIESFDVDD